MQVLLLTPNIAPIRGGIAQLSTGLIRALRESGVKVATIAGADHWEIGADRLCIRVAGEARPVSVCASLTFVVTSVASVIVMRPDLVHAVTWRAAAPVAVLPSWIRPPFVVTALGTELNRAGRVAAKIRDVVFARATRVVAISSATETVVRETITGQCAPIVVIPPGIDLQLDPVQARPIGRIETLRILSVGRLDPRKGHDELIRAVAAVLARGFACELRIVGSGPDRSRLESLIFELELAGSVLLLGSVSIDELNAEYLAADVFALLTRSVGAEFEGFGIAFLEAAAFGLPIVAGDSGGAIEATSPGENAFVVKSAQEAADAIATLASDGEVRTRMMRASLEHVDDFAWSTIADRYSGVFLEALGR